MPTILFPTVLLSTRFPPDDRLVWVYCTEEQCWRLARYHATGTWTDGNTSEPLDGSRFTHWAERNTAPS